MFSRLRLKVLTTTPLSFESPTATINREPAITHSSSSTNSLSKPAKSTDLHQYANQDPYYVTLALTRPQTTLISLILLDNALPTPTGTSNSASAQGVTIRNSGMSTPTIVGTVFGVTLSFLLLVGVLYVYILRARQFARMKAGSSRRSVSSRNKRRRRGSSGSFVLFNSWWRASSLETA